MRRISILLLGIALFATSSVLAQTRVQQSSAQPRSNTQPRGDTNTAQTTSQKSNSSEGFLHRKPEPETMSDEEEELDFPEDEEMNDGKKR